MHPLRGAIVVFARVTIPEYCCPGSLIATATIGAENYLSVFGTACRARFANNALFSRLRCAFAAGGFLFSAVLANFVDDVSAE